MKFKDFSLFTSDDSSLIHRNPLADNDRLRANEIEIVIGITKRNEIENGVILTKN